MSTLSLSPFQLTARVVIVFGLLVLGIRLGVRLEYNGVSMWWVVLTAAAVWAVARWSTHSRLAECQGALMTLTALLAFMTYRNDSQRFDFRRSGDIDRVVIAARTGPGQLQAKLRGMNDGQLARTRNAIPTLVEPEIRRRRLAVEAAETERLRRRMAWQQSPIGWIAGFVGWIVSPAH